MTIEVRNLPPQRVAYLRHFGEYGLVPTLKTLNRLVRWAGPRGLLERGQLLGIPWNNPRVTLPEECCYDACLTVGPEFHSDHPLIEVQSLVGGTYLVRSVKVENGDLETPWQEFLAWYHESDWQLSDDPCFEVYRSDSHQDPSGNWSMELHMPVLER